MKRKTAHVITKYFYPVAAGIETNILETYSVLVQEGWDVTIHTSLDTLTEKNVLQNEIKELKGLKIKRYPFTWYGIAPDINWDSADIVALHNFNIVPHFFLMAYTYVRKCLGKKNYALVLTPHGGFNPEWSIFSPLTRYIKKIYHFTIGTLLINLSVDCVRAVSNWEGREITNKGVSKKKVTVITNGVEDEAYMDVDALASPETKQRVKDLGRYIIQIGRIYPIKNLETTIRALPHVSRDVKYLILGPTDHVMGKSSYKDDLETLAQELGVADRVIFGGVVRGVDKFYYIKHAQMMVHMALWESFCNVVHEGLSQGLVCIVANNTALPLLIKDGVHGFCVETHDSDTVAEKINYVLENKESTIIKDMQRRNREFGLEESWTNVAYTVDTLYTSLIAQK